MKALRHITLTGILLLWAGGVLARPPLRDAPIVWYDRDEEALTEVPDERDPDLYWDYYNEGIGYKEKKTINTP